VREQARGTKQRSPTGHVALSHEENDLIGRQAGAVAVTESITRGSLSAHRGRGREDDLIEEATALIARDREANLEEC
jgi:hypothetical protein